ncbi:MAG: hypothetical protein LBS75_05510 [Synergistaceae bacterium]|jgi:hypothetical protein|nr:hypothetical protein [Synergistaceae bacterium]
MYGQPGDLPKNLRIDAFHEVPSVSEVNRVKKKGRKRGAVSDVAWKDALAESVCGASVGASETVEERAEVVEKAAWEEPPDSISPETVRRGGGDEAEFDSMLEEIRRMAEVPEKLLESHLGVFIEPAPPGKILNSRG